MLNPGANQYFSGYIPPLSPEAYQNQMYQQNELPLQAPMPNAGYPEQEPKNMMPQPAPAAVMPAPLAPPQYQSVPSSALAEQMKPKQKRRSKNERNGRDYICGCGKTYLSYPALYTHIKTKHGGQNPCGTQQLQTGRGRGRPRKVRFSLAYESCSRTPCSWDKLRRDSRGQKPCTEREKETENCGQERSRRPRKH